MATTKLSSFHLEQVVLELVPLEDIALEFINNTTQDMDAGSAQAFRNKCDNFIKEGQLQALVDAFLDGLKLVGPVASVRDTEARFSILFSLARHLPPDVLDFVVPRVTSVVLELPLKSGAKEDQEMRVSVLRNLYTVLDAKSSTRFSTLLKLVEYAKENALFAVWDSTSPLDIEELCSTWSKDGDTDDEMKKTLYKAFCDLVESKREKKNGTERKEEDVRTEELKEYRFLVKLLELYEASPEELGSVRKYASRAALLSIKYPLPGDMAVSNTLEAFDGLNRRAATAVLTAEQTHKVDWSSLATAPSSLYHLASVKYLSSVPEYSTLYKLLQIFAADGLEELQEFIKQNPKAFGDLGISEESALNNIRLLTLASLAAKNEAVSYQTIAEQLRVEDAQVEKWVIQGITQKVIDAKMDQSNQKIVINRGSQRLITDKQWEEVQEKLAQWKSSVRSLLTTIKAVRQENEAMQQQMQGAAPQIAQQQPPQQ